LKKIERKLRMFWFYPGRHINYEEAVIEGSIDAESSPKYWPKKGIEVKSNY